LGDSLDKLFDGGAFASGHSAATSEEGGEPAHDRSSESDSDGGLSDGSSSSSASDSEVSTGAAVENDGSDGDTVDSDAAGWLSPGAAVENDGDTVDSDMAGWLSPGAAVETDGDTVDSDAAVAAGLVSPGAVVENDAAAVDGALYAVVLPAIFLYALFQLGDRLTGWSKKLASPDPKKHAFLITGAGSGFGLAVSEALAKRGFTVFCGVFPPCGKEERAAIAKVGTSLEGSSCGRLVPVDFDITKHESIEAGLEIVTKELSSAGLELFGLHNNAGMALAMPMVCVTPEQLAKQYNVNLFGHIATTTAALPLLMRCAQQKDSGTGVSNARIVSTISVAGRIAGRNFGPYSGSKHALEATTDAWRSELSPYNILAIGIEPGYVKTPLVEQILKRGLADWERASNRELFPDFEDSLRAGGDMAYNKLGMELADSVPYFLDALTSPTPRPRYSFAKPPSPMLFLWLPTHLRDFVTLKLIPGAGNFDAPAAAAAWLATLGKKD
jgi:NAD(P)-dependent dehydrogenase (short-subunit alcohol dehydrogenase family)